jgi:hypothetical protein
MPPISFYPPGVPCWIDTEQPDPERARHFYARVMHWTAGAVTGADEPDMYFVAALDGLAVAGIDSCPGEQARWNTYISVDDVDAAVKRVTDAGGVVHAAPFDAGDRGRAARCADPSGAIFCLWQAREMAGAEVIRIPGAWEVSDLHSDDLDGAGTFYGAVFGWETGTVDVGAGEWATLFRVPGYGEHRAQQADALTHDDDAAAADAISWLAPLESPDPGPYWRVSFTVGDRDAATTAAQRLGAEIVSELDSRWTRSALVRDPQGAMFTVTQALSGQ